MSKIQRAPCKSKSHGAPDAVPEPTQFADAITSDHKILNEDHESRSHDQVAFIIQDRYTQWLQGYTCKD